MHKINCRHLYLIHFRDFMNSRGPLPEIEIETFRAGASIERNQYLRWDVEREKICQLPREKQGENKNTSGVDNLRRVNLRGNQRTKLFSDVCQISVARMCFALECDLNKSSMEMYTQYTIFVCIQNRNWDRC